MLYAFEIVLYALFMLSPVAAREIRPRVIGGEPDDGQEFPFAVMLQGNEPPMFRLCSGSLIAPTWVLTACHCLPPKDVTVRKTRVKYGNTTIPSNETKFFAKIIKATRHPGCQISDLPKQRNINDIGLLKIERISNTPLAKLSGIDYAAFMGLPVKYAGFGRTNYLLKGETIPPLVVWHDLDPPLRLGEAVVISCKQNGRHGGVFIGNPHICIAPRCGPHHQQAYYGDSGGPLLHNGRIIGVACGADYHYLDEEHIPLLAYTAVSPFLDWIYDTIHSD